MDHLFSTVVNSTYTSLFYFGPALVVIMSGLKESQRYEYVEELRMLKYKIIEAAHYNLVNCYQPRVKAERQICAS